MGAVFTHNKSQTTFVRSKTPPLDELYSVFHKISHRGAASLSTVPWLAWRQFWRRSNYWASIFTVIYYAIVWLGLGQVANP